MDTIEELTIENLNKELMNENHLLKNEILELSREIMLLKTTIIKDLRYQLDEQIIIQKAYQQKLSELMNECTSEETTSQTEFVEYEQFELIPVND